VWRNALEKAGMLRVDPVTKWATLKPHNLRKFFRLMVGRYGRDEAEALMGHQTGLNRVYARFEERAGDKRLEEVYRQAIPDLSIRETPEGSDLRGIREEMETLREQNRVLRDRINDITESRKGSDDVMNRLFEDPEFREVLRKKLKDLI